MNNQLVFFLLLLSLMAWGCSENLCETADCGPYGTCFTLDDEVNCNCDDGFEKDETGRCTVFSITQYPGTYSASERCTSKLDGSVTEQSYSLEISLRTSEEIALGNLGNQDCGNSPLQVPARVEGNDFTLVEDSYCLNAIDQTQYNISGAGFITADSLSLDYELSFTQFGTVTRSEGCNLRLIRQ
jgi:hypothetical protein